MAEKKKKEIKLKDIRKASQVIVLLLMLVLTYLIHSKAFSVRWLAPIWHLHALFANRFDLSTMIYLGEGLTRISIPSVTFLGVFVLMGVLFGRIFCGWLCPFGTLLEYIESITPLKGKLHIPEEFKDTDTKYAILAGFLLLSLMTSQAAFCEFCPVGTIVKGGAGHVIFLSIPVFAIVLFIALFYGRKVWCSYLCPLGAFFGLFSRIHLFGIHADKDKCVKCMMCNNSCPMDIPIVENYILEGKKITDGECIKCMDCIDACPRKILKFP